ncbi:MAG: serine--tRNA ligase [Candidatus Magasanikbacteria bacterium CG10_big_fil_rev_8_21_14_0_10_47_10]|uniref:Serine--tRNA ligase n=1 Tax=Candidatus Magasanikbacteria bacterium CG10_big_fil_rev_8_21_14_0_10_47_10 TaxID=1974652 RepID=A0A2H0TQS7_9BACT|nr:MAG: serine--tRNA ligase [Candidatus Magasanikbacteria bacterium CG10_big_fil_rev_8_21_14_0_10_47_10]
MLDITLIRKNSDEIKANCQRRGVAVDIDALLLLDSRRRDLQQQTDDLRGIKRKQSKGKPDEKQRKEMKELGAKIKQLEKELNEIEAQYTISLLQVPNLTHPDSPTGGEAEFKELELLGKKPSFSFDPLDHETLLVNADLLDFDRGAKVSGSKFYYTKGDLARLNMALIQYGIGIVSEFGYQLMETPDLAREEIAIGAGFNPRGDEDQIYTIAGTDISLIGTAEITTLGYHAGETLNLSDGPIKYAAISHCFRKEAGAYGRTSKGLYRVHQFTKLELFVFCTPEMSDQMHRELLDIEKTICNGLGIHYRVIDVASGDLGAPAYRKYDLEAWMVMKGENGGYGEITSTSNCLDYQSRRLGIRYANGDAKGFAHTLNGTAIVSSRLPIALVEQFQQEDGRVQLPTVLATIMGQTHLG